MQLFIVLIKNLMRLKIGTENNERNVKKIILKKND